MTARLLPSWLLGSLLLLSNCNQRDEPQLDLTPDLAVQVSYLQTQCADKWGQASTTQQLEARATAYLTQQGITFTNPKASQVGGPAACAACTCSTGVVLEGTVPTSQLLAIQKLGFRKL